MAIMIGTPRHTRVQQIHIGRKMQVDHNGKKYALTLLHAIFYYGKFLGIANCRFDRNHLMVRRMQRSGKCVARIVRFLLIVTYVGALQKLFTPIENKSFIESGSFIGIFTILQLVSVMIFALFVFLVQIRGEKRITKMLNCFIKLFRRVAARSNISPTRMLNQKFIAVLMLKTATTFLGYLDEVPSLMQPDESEGVLYFIHLISSMVGVYLWMGSMFVLDSCVLGLLIIALMYEEMGNFLRNMLNRMKSLEEDEVGEVKMQRKQLTNHRRMKLLCDYADIITDCDTIYAELYALTKKFECLFQWQIIYYIYYNFMVVLLLFHNCIWTYLHNDHIDLLALLMVLVKIANLALLIMCADFLVQRSQIPQLLCLDLVCSDIDDRWCMSAESFLNRRQIERLEIKVLGFFELNNEFILLILSAIVSYLFIIIQFGLSDKLTV